MKPNKLNKSQIQKSAALKPQTFVIIKPLFSLLYLIIYYYTTLSYFFFIVSFDTLEDRIYKSIQFPVHNGIHIYFFIIGSVVFHKGIRAKHIGPYLASPCYFQLYTFQVLYLFLVFALFSSISFALSIFMAVSLFLELRAFALT